MINLVNNRLVVEVSETVVLFLFGLKVHNYMRIDKWWPAKRSLKKIVSGMDPEHIRGFLGQEQWYGNHCFVIQYWQSIDALRAFAADKQNVHFPEWVNYNMNIASSGVVGIWHEIYKISPQNLEAVYTNMPPIGLGRVGQLKSFGGNKITRHS